MKKLVNGKWLIIYSSLFIVFLLSTIYHLPSTIHAKDLSIASTYLIDDKDAVLGDILISSEKGLTRTNVTYNSRIFGVLQDSPLIVFREATGSAKRPVVRTGDVSVNINDFNGEIKKGDLVTTSPALGKGMKAGQSGYVLGVALENAAYQPKTSTLETKQIKNGTVLVAMKIEYAEITTARNSFRLLDQLNAAFFRSIQDPEKFTLTIRYIIAGLIALVGFALGFYSVSKSVTKAVEAIGRNPLARKTIIASIVLQLVITLVGIVGMIVLIYIIIRL